MKFLPIGPAGWLAGWAAEGSGTIVDDLFGLARVLFMRMFDKTRYTGSL